MKKQITSPILKKLLLQHLSYWLYNILSPAARAYQSKKKLSWQILKKKNNISCDVWCVLSFILMFDYLVMDPHPKYIAHHQRNGAPPTKGNIKLNASTTIWVLLNCEKDKLWKQFDNKSIHIIQRKSSFVYWNCHKLAFIATENANAWPFQHRPKR